MANTTNGKTTDYLKVDPPLVIDCKKPQMRQNWAVVSFISPEDRIKQRFLYEANKFLFHDVNKQIVDTTINLAKDINTEFNKILEKKINSYKSSNELSYRAAADILDHARQELQLNEDDQVNKTLRKYRIDQQELVDRFEVYKMQNNKEIEADFNKEFTDETSVRGFKIRGAFEDLADAQERAKKARNEFEPAVHSFAVPVGYWCPWDPNADAVQDQDYMLPELNDLMGKYQRNVEQRNEFYEKRKQMMMDGTNNSKDKQLKERLRQRLADKQTQRLTNQMKEVATSKEKSEPQQSTENNQQKNKNRKKKKNTNVPSQINNNNQQKQKSNDNNITVSQDRTNKTLTFNIPK